MSGSHWFRKKQAAAPPAPIDIDDLAKRVAKINELPLRVHEAPLSMLEYNLGRSRDYAQRKNTVEAWQGFEDKKAMYEVEVQRRASESDNA